MKKIKEVYLIWYPYEHEGMEDVDIVNVNDNYLGLAGYTRNLIKEGRISNDSLKEWRKSKGVKNYLPSSDDDAVDLLTWDGYSIRKREVY